MLSIGDGVVADSAAAAIRYSAFDSSRARNRLTAGSEEVL